MPARSNDFAMSYFVLYKDCSRFVPRGKLTLEMAAFIAVSALGLPGHPRRSREQSIAIQAALYAIDHWINGKEHGGRPKSEIPPKIATHGRSMSNRQMNYAAAA